MKITNRMNYMILGWLLLAAPSALAVEEKLPDSEVLMKAMADELSRSMELQMEDLEKPYFIAYMVDDSLNYSMTASYGAVVSFDRDRSRRFNNQVRVGSYELDNTNFSGGGGGFSFRRGGGRGGRGGGRASLPLDDDYTALRQAMWWSTDSNYKGAVETLTQKIAYMKDKNLTDRPHDFTRVDAVEHIAPTATINFERPLWESHLKKLSGRFKEYPGIQDAEVRITVGASNRYLVNSEGTRLRTANNGILLSVSANGQAEDGRELSHGFTFFGRTAKDLPSFEKIMEKVDTVAGELTAVLSAPVLEGGYNGPVLFDDAASAQLFRELVAGGVTGRPESVGSGRRSRRGGSSSLESKLNQRILPKGFKMYDDPSVEAVDGVPLLGHYVYDDEGVKAERVDIIENGMLKNLLMSRVPTKKLTGSNGHGRRAASSGRSSAAVGSLFVESGEGMTGEELKQALLEAAADEGLEYGLRISRIRTAGASSSMNDLVAMLMRGARRGGGGGGPSLGDPIIVYKVYVDDGREEMVGGCEFTDIQIKDFKDILAAGKEPVVYNYIGLGMGGSSPATSIVAPAVLFEEVELMEIEGEPEKPPIMKSPIFR
jgi:hypothetical protein